jgi:hypothetical protein
MQMFRDASTDTLQGLESFADVAVPLSPEYPAVPVPATVEMFPPASTFRMRWFSVSAM